MHHCHCGNHQEVDIGDVIRTPTATENTRDPDSSEEVINLEHFNMLKYQIDQATDMDRIITKQRDDALAVVEDLKHQLLDSEWKRGLLETEVERLKATCHALRQSATAVTNYDGKVATWPEIASLIRDERDACGLSA